MTPRRPANMLVLLAGVALAACAAHRADPPAAQPVPQPLIRPVAEPVPAGAAARKDIHWFRSSAEYRGIALETYHAAAEHLAEFTIGLASGSWAVILDADETVLDNSAHERQLADRGESYTESGWSSWVRERAATAVPGSVEFIHVVRAMGGRVAIVTNRADSLCAPTRDNLHAIGADADAVLCKVGDQGDKNPRFQMIQNGTAIPGLPALKVVEWLGDNIQDFPGLSQEVRTRIGGYADFGVRYFLLPNPMYGSWERNPEP